MNKKIIASLIVILALLSIFYFFLGPKPKHKNYSVSIRNYENKTISVKLLVEDELVYSGKIDAPSFQGNEIKKFGGGKLILPNRFFQLDIFIEDSEKSLNILPTKGQYIDITYGIPNEEVLTAKQIDRTLLLD